METKNKLLILSLSFAIFIVGVRALYSEPGRRAQRRVGRLGHGAGRDRRRADGAGGEAE